MASNHPPVVFDDDNPEWTEADFARAGPIADFPELAAAFPNGGKPRGRPTGSTTSDKSLVSLRIDNDVLSGSAPAGRAGRAAYEALRKAAGV